MIDNRQSEIGPAVRGQFPWVSCLCPTYGRFEALRDALACFLLQDYPNKHLIILNDAPVEIPNSNALTHLGVIVVNNESRIRSLGAKRQRLLEIAEEPIVAHWDDDDLYLPWHLTQCVEALLQTREVPIGNRKSAIGNVLMVKPRGAWYMLGSRSRPRGITVRGIHHNVFEGAFVFDRRLALRYGYPPTDSGQAAALGRAFTKDGLFHRFDPYPFVSYVYRWADGLGHVSAAKTGEKFAAQNRDFGDPVGEGLLPHRHLAIGNWQCFMARQAMARQWATQRLSHYFDALDQGASEALTVGEYGAFNARLRACLNPLEEPFAVPDGATSVGAHGGAPDVGARSRLRGMPSIDRAGPSTGIVQT